MKAKYGIPYMGSKDKIAEDIIRCFPPAENFYDLFGGGFSITHAMLEKRQRDYKNFYFNEPRNGVCNLIQKAINGEYSYDKFLPEFIDREVFFEKLESDPTIKILWSFGNDGASYIFSKEITPYKKSMHEAIVFNRFDELAKKVFGFESFKEGYSVKERRLLLRNRIEFFKKKGPPSFLYRFLKKNELENLEQLQQLQRLERLEQLERLQQKNHLNKLEYYCTTYDQVPIAHNSIIYCDPPYLGTGNYDGNKNFDYKKFINWAAENESPVFISEYNIPDKRLRLIKTFQKRSLFNPAKKALYKTEKLYVNQSGLNLLTKIKKQGKKYETKN